MANLDLIVLESNAKKRKQSSTVTADFLAVRLGASNLEVKETAGHFDFSNKKLTNIADPTSDQDVATKAYVDSVSGGGQPAVPRAYVEGGTITATQVSSNDTWTDVTGATVTVTPVDNNEKWEIVFQGTADFNGGADMAANFRIVDSSNNLIDNSIVYFAKRVYGGFYPSGRIIRVVARDTVSAAKTYKLQAKKGSLGTNIQFWVGNYTGSLTDPEISQKIYAAKVPNDSVYVDSSAISSTQVTSDDTWTDVTGASILVTPAAANEKVEVNFRGSLAMILAANTACYAAVRIVDSSNNLIDSAIGLIIDRMTTADTVSQPMMLTARDTISAAKTYKLQVRKSGASAAWIYQDSASAQLTDPDSKQVFYAQRFPTAPTYLDSSAISTTTVTSTDVWTDVAGASVQITPSTAGEKWELRFQGHMDMLSNNQNAMLGNIRIVDSSNNLIDASSSLMIANTDSGAGYNILQHIDLVARATVNATTTYKLQIRKSSEGTHARVLGGNDFTVTLTNPDFSQRFWAVKYDGAGGGQSGAIDPSYVSASPASILTTSNTLHDAFQDVTGASITINPTSSNQKWEIYAHASVAITNDTSNPPTNRYAYLRIADSGNNLIDDAEIVSARTGADGLAGTVDVWPMSLVARVTLSASTTYKLQIKTWNGGGSTAITRTQIFGGPSYKVKFFAKRVY